MTTDLHALGPEDQPVPGPPARNRPASPYERARLAADALTAQILEANRGTQQTTDVATVDQTRRTFEAAATMAAKLQDGIRDRALTYGPRTPPAPATATPPHPQQPRTQPGRTPSGGAA